MIPSAVFVAAVALQNTFPLSSKFSRNPGSMPKTYRLHMFCRPRESIWLGSSWKALGGCGSTVLTGASKWPSSHCIPAEKIVSVSTKLNHSRSALVLDCDDGVCRTTSGFSTLRAPGQIRPANGTYPKKAHYARCPILELLCNSLCGPLPKKIGEPRSIWIG